MHQDYIQAVLIYENGKMEYIECAKGTTHIFRAINEKIDYADCSGFPAEYIEMKKRSFRITMENIMNHIIFREYDYASTT